MTYTAHIPTEAIPPTASQSKRDQRIQAAQTRAISVMRSTPEKARSVNATIGRVGEGLACHIHQGKYSALADLGAGMGGDATGPSPSFFARAAIAGCVAIAIKMLAAREGRTFASVEVTVETDFDDLALFGLGEYPAAPIETRIGIDVTSDEASGVVADIVERALEMDPWFLALRDAQRVVTDMSQRSATPKIPDNDSPAS